MYKYKRNGFTLVELMAVIIIISLIALLTFPNIINQIKKTKKSNNKMIEDIVLTQAKKYVSDNKDEFNDNEYCIGIDTLLDNDYIKDDIVKNSDIVDTKVIFLSNDKYVLMDKDKCKVNNCKSDYCDDDGNEYTEALFLESTGTQYINTGYKPNQNTKVETKIKVLKTQTEFYFGARTTNSSEMFSLVQNENKFRSDFANSQEPIYTNNYTTMNSILGYPDFIIVKDKNVTNINNSFTSTLNYENFQSPYEMYIFALNTSDNLTGTSEIELYYFKIYEGDVLKRDYIPVLDSKGVPCLYDKVEKICYYNQGTGEFLYG